MSSLKDVAQRRERRIAHEKSRQRRKLGIWHEMEIDTRVPAGVADLDELVDAEPAPLMVALAERVGR